jgi:hypothetical protein
LAEIKDCYCVGTVDGHVVAGGFASLNSATIRRCYSVGPIRSDGEAGGFLGKSWFLHDGICEQAYWDTDSSGLTTSVAGTGMAGEQMKQQASFVGWDFLNVWTICEGQDYPRLRWEDVACER